MVMIGRTVSKGAIVKYQGLSLAEWIARGRANGTIADTLMVVWAYCMDEDEALRWITAIVGGELNEQVALTRIRGSQPADDMPLLTAGSNAGEPVAQAEQTGAGRADERDSGREVTALQTPHEPYFVAAIPDRRIMLHPAVQTELGAETHTQHTI